MRIGELARRTGVSERSLRYYEQQGLISARRTAGGHREYDVTAVAAVDRIQCLFSAGLCSSKIAELLPCMRSKEAGGPAPDLLHNLAVERERIDGMIDRLLASRDILDEVIDSARTPSAAPGEAARSR
ncbi:MerR family transcriptional regulator [Spinactinospora alkalitolerans]|nr:MerR family transcriptional regulator [Spinactinospora alkalitolerans]